MDKVGRVELHRAAAKGDADRCAQLLRELPADLPSRDPHLLVHTLLPDKVGDTPLHHAARSGSLQCVRRLRDVSKSQQSTFTAPQPC